MTDGEAQQRGWETVADGKRSWMMRGWDAGRGGGRRRRMEPDMGNGDGALGGGSSGG